MYEGFLDNLTECFFGLHASLTLLAGARLCQQESLWVQLTAESRRQRCVGSAFLLSPCWDLGKMSVYLRRSYKPCFRNVPFITFTLISLNSYKLYNYETWNDDKNISLLNYLLTYIAEPFLRSCHLCSYLRTSQYFTEPEGSLPCSQEPSTGPYPELDQSSPWHPILFL
jgi:hypothetical protein